jgi:hypothetical protein
MSAISHPVAESEVPPPIDGPLPHFLAGRIPESDLAFSQRRALEEAVASQRARTPQAAAAHRYLSAAYAEQARRASEAESRFDALVQALP